MGRRFGWFLLAFLGFSARSAGADNADAGAACAAGTVEVKGGAFTPASAKLATQVGALCFDKTEVTVAAYEACVKSGACTEPKSSGGCTWKAAGLGLHPVNCVDVTQAAAFCKSVGARLPSEPEWEWAARSGASAKTYPWGDAAPDATRANACGAECAADKSKNDLGGDKLHDADDKFVATAPVGSFPKGASADGVLDLAGNVAEWAAPTADGKSAAARGGHFWVYEAKWLAATSRDVWAIGYRDPKVGFRCVRPR